MQKFNQKTLRAVIYARYSSHQQTEQSIEGQLRDCYTYAQQHNYSIVSEYIDRAKSAKADLRPEFQRMIQSYIAATAAVLCSATVQQDATVQHIFIIPAHRAREKAALAEKRVFIRI